MVNDILKFIHAREILQLTLAIIVLPKQLIHGRILQLNFGVEDKSLHKIYHPSEINVYPPAKPVNSFEIR